MSNVYLDVLDEQEDQMGVAQTSAIQVLNTLEELISSLENNDGSALDHMAKIASQNECLLKEIVNLRLAQINAIESHRTRVKLGPSAELARSKLFLSTEERDDPHNLFDYFEELKQLHESWMRHISLLSNLSDELAFKFESKEGNKVFVNSTAYPTLLKDTIEKYDEFRDQQEDTEYLRLILFEYLDEIKTGRAKFALENKYILKKSLQELTKEVSEWSQRWSTTENTLFGDSPTSLKKFIQKTEEVMNMMEGFDSEGDTKMI